MKKDMTIEQAMKRLDEITVAMMDDSMQIDKSLKLFEEGLALIKFCDEKLKAAELKITKLTNESVSEDE